MFGPPRLEGIACLVENGQARLRLNKTGLKRSKPMHFDGKGKNNFKWDGRKCAWTAQARADRVSSEVRHRKDWALKDKARAR